jgi:predicted aconitase
MAGFEDDEYVKIDGQWLHSFMKMTAVFFTPYDEGWIKKKIISYTDLGALGFFAGKIGAFVPVFEGLSGITNIEDIQQLFGALGMVAPVALAHIVGVTPEASTTDEAFGDQKPKKIVTVGRKELEKACEALNTAQGKDVDFVMLGCHFCTIEKIRKISKLLENKRVHDGITLWIQTSQTVKKLAERDGDIQKIEKAGARIYCDACVLATSVNSCYFCAFCGSA